MLRYRLLQAYSLLALLLVSILPATGLATPAFWYVKAEEKDTSRQKALVERYKVLSSKSHAAGERAVRTQSTKRKTPTVQDNLSPEGWQQHGVEDCYGYRFKKALPKEAQLTQPKRDILTLVKAGLHSRNSKTREAAKRARFSEVPYVVDERFTGKSVREAAGNLAALGKVKLTLKAVRMGDPKARLFLELVGKVLSWHENSALDKGKLVKGGEGFNFGGNTKADRRAVARYQRQVASSITPAQAAALIVEFAVAKGKGLDGSDELAHGLYFGTGLHKNPDPILRLMTAAITDRIQKLTVPAGRSTNVKRARAACSAYLEVMQHSVSALARWNGDPRFHAVRSAIYDLKDKLEAAFNDASKLGSLMETVRPELERISTLTAAK